MRQVREEQEAIEKLIKEAEEQEKVIARQKKERQGKDPELGEVYIPGQAQCTRD